MKRLLNFKSKPSRHLVVLRGGGDITTGIAVMLRYVGYKVLILEQPNPTSLRREASFADAAYDGEKTIERLTCRLAANFGEAEKIWKQYGIAMLIDPDGRCAKKLKNYILIDGVPDGLAADSQWSGADFKIGLGESFCAGQDVDCVIDLSRGFNMGKIVREGRTGKLAQRNAINDLSDYIVTAPANGVFAAKRAISSLVHKGDVIGILTDLQNAEHEILSPSDGVLRGLIHNSCRIREGLEIAEIDARVSPRQCSQVADRARAVAGSALTAIIMFENGRWSGAGRFGAVL